jgi:hypothetical protein
MASAAIVVPGQMNGFGTVTSYRQFGSWMHATPHWNTARVLSLWTLTNSDGSTQNLVQFDNKAMHGNWGVTRTNSNEIESIIIKFHWKADNALARCHLFEPVQGTEAYVCKVQDANNAAWTQYLLPMKPVIVAE